MLSMTQVKIRRVCNNFVHYVKQDNHLYIEISSVAEAVGLMNNKFVLKFIPKLRESFLFVILAEMKKKHLKFCSKSYNVVMVDL